ncbi:MAG: GAF domain-containing protein [Chloroflexota bacterium]|nr:GAF domain-containing protein [Chloroflexota bacterium]
MVELAEAVLRAQSFEEFAAGVLPILADTIQSRSALLYVGDSRLPVPRFFHYGIQPEAVSAMKNLCEEQFDQVSAQVASQPVAIHASPLDASLTLYPLRAEEGRVGLIGLMARKETTLTLADGWERLFRWLADTLSRLAKSAKAERQIAHLNTYLTVSSLIAQPLGLYELLETALYCCMEAVSAEAASILLLDDEEKSFCFYQVEGPAEPVLHNMTFPANRGIAGAVLQTQQSEVVNVVHSDPRFYERIDSESGFQTRNMIAIPLTASEKPVGVLQVLNKASGESFTEEEHLLLLSVAEEIAFAVRNAIVFEYVVNSYCKQRQGQASCKGCERPLGIWTPCVKYREASL